MQTMESIRIEVEEDHLVLVLPRFMDDWMTPWQEAWQLGDVIEQAAADIPQKCLLDQGRIQLDQAQIRISTHQDRFVVLLFQHVDRVKLCYEAARLVARAIRMKAQDLDLLTRGVRMQYNAPGRIGRPTPFWAHIRKVFGRK